VVSVAGAAAHAVEAHPTPIMISAKNLFIDFYPIEKMHPFLYVSIGRTRHFN
jgi:hypothetical protein